MEGKRGDIIKCSSLQTLFGGALVQGLMQRQGAPAHEGAPADEEANNIRWALPNSRNKADARNSDTEDADREGDDEGKGGPSGALDRMQHKSLLRVGVLEGREVEDAELENDGVEDAD
jgi:hypothetical protein